MKLYKYCFALLALTTVTVSGCKNEDINDAIPGKGVPGLDGGSH